MFFNIVYCVIEGFEICFEEANMSQIVHQINKRNVLQETNKRQDKFPSLLSLSLRKHD